MGKKEVGTSEQTTSVTNTLIQRFDSFSPAERKVAKRILETPRIVSELNVSQLAESCSVSDATVVRMSQHAGYSGYYEMRIYLMRDLEHGDGPERTIIASNPVSYSFEKDLLLLKTLCSKDNIGAIEHAAEMILQAETVFIAAIGNTTPLADDLEFRLNSLGVRAFTSEKIETQLRYAENARKNDLFIVISKSGASVGVMKLVEMAAERGIDIIAITSSQISPLARVATHIVNAGDTDKIFDQLKPRVETHLGELFVINALVFQVDIKLREHVDSPSGEDLELTLSSFKI